MQVLRTQKMLSLPVQKQCCIWVQYKRIYFRTAKTAHMSVICNEMRGKRTKRAHFFEFRVLSSSFSAALHQEWKRQGEPCRWARRRWLHVLQAALSHLGWTLCGPWLHEIAGIALTQGYFANALLVLQPWITCCGTVPGLKDAQAWALSLCCCACSPV